jgi:hypothetical protein
VQPPIAAGKPGEISLQELCKKIKFVQGHLKPKKHHNTAGYFAMLVRIAINRMFEDDEGNEYEQEEDGCNDPLAWEGDLGGYRDVGRHTNVVPLSTCWPLVEQVFHYLADQVCYAKRL